MKVYFATTNRKKFEEAFKVAGKFKIRLEIARVNAVEPQGELNEIALSKALQAFEKVKKPVVVEDSGLFIRALKGFPGPYSSFVYRTIGCEGILKLMRGLRERKAEFRCAAVYYDGAHKIEVLESVEGRIAEKVRGKGGFGFDPIFIPEGFSKTFAEAPEIKVKVSHRTRALERLFSALQSLLHSSQ